MDIVLGVSVAPTSVRMVMLQGEDGDGTAIDENEFPVTPGDDAPTVSATDRVVAAIMCTREDAAGAGLELDSIGVACTDQLEAAVLRDALAARKIENVMLVSAFLAAVALTQSVGGAMGYERTAMLFVEPEAARLAVVETADGSVDELYEERLDPESGHVVTAALMEMVAGLDGQATPPGGLFVVGPDVDVAAVGRRLEQATSLVVNVPAEPETALARGAALASANALTSSTAALAYAQDPGTGAVDVSALPEYLSIAAPFDDGLAYGAVDDDEADAVTVAIGPAGGGEPRPRPGLLVGSVLAIVGFSAALALEVALSFGIRTTVDSLPAPIQGVIAPVQQIFAPAPEVAAIKMAAPVPLSPGRVPPPAAPAPPAPLPAAAPVAVPAAPVPAPPSAPIPVLVPPVAPVPVPPVHWPDPPAGPPILEAPPHPTPPTQPPPTHLPPPPHRLPPAQSPVPDSGSGGPTSGPHPVHGNPGGGEPRGGGPGDVPSHGTPGGAPSTGGQSPTNGGSSAGGQNPTGGSGPASGGGAPTGGGPTGGSESPSSGGASGGSSSSGGSNSSGESSGGASGGSGSSSGESSGGSSSSGSSGSSSAGESSSSGSSGGGSESGGSHH